jgi:hypothetical protein
VVVVPHLEALGDDATLLVLASGEAEVQGMQEPRPELHGIRLRVCGELPIARIDDGLQELVRGHLPFEGAQVPHLAHELTKAPHELALAVLIALRKNEKVPAGARLASAAGACSAACRC